ncbi:hypothetical protein GCWU000324_01446 [Kingella oralis ATCC 51147]|uniref:Uncharacterized protein n=1 Tax=Kingella oralis ATCC 51147 TaxID=629741 RepID=C4GKE3_9NEIS|nr:hypothetical protein GCWU000324_01446 [Kingella oralis ATCC 51147]
MITHKVIHIGSLKSFGSKPSPLHFRFQAASGFLQRFQPA